MHPFHGESISNLSHNMIRIEIWHELSCTLLSAFLQTSISFFIISLRFRGLFRTHTHMRWSLTWNYKWVKQATANLERNDEQTTPFFVMHWSESFKKQRTFAKKASNRRPGLTSSKGENLSALDSHGSLWGTASLDCQDQCFSAVRFASSFLPAICVVAIRMICKLLYKILQEQ